MVEGAKYSEPIKNKSGYYEVRWTEWDDGAKRGRSRSASCGTKSKPQALIFRENFIAAQQAIAEVETGYTVAGICDIYETRHLGEKSFHLVSVRRELGDLDIGELSEEAVDAFRELRLTQVASGTARRDLNSLRSAVNWCASPRRKPRILGDDFRVPVFDLPPDGKPRDTFIPRDDAKRLFALAAHRATGGGHFSRRRIGLFLCLALETAARSGAIRGLTWDRVRLDEGFIDYRDPGMKVTKKRRVPVPISVVLRPVLEDAYAKRDPNSDYVLGHPGSIRTAYVNFMGEHGFGPYRPHDLRRTWATLRVMAGAPMGQVAAILGDTLEVTERHYAHLQPGYGRSVIDMEI
jgi:integrase